LNKDEKSSIFRKPRRERKGRGAGGEIAQTMYAHMNK
jgi:hypothetical protein